MNKIWICYDGRAAGGDPSDAQVMEIKRGGPPNQVELKKAKNFGNVWYEAQVDNNRTVTSQEIYSP